jgi:hypothetical protein
MRTGKPWSGMSVRPFCSQQTITSLAGSITLCSGIDVP